MPTPQQHIEQKVKEFEETGASIEHERWAKWQKYMHSHVYDSSMSINPHLKVIPTELFERWERQIETPYSELSEKEKESDRIEARKYISFLTSALKEHGKIVLDSLREVVKDDEDAIETLEDIIQESLTHPLLDNQEER